MIGIKLILRKVRTSFPIFLVVGGIVLKQLELRDLIEMNGEMLELDKPIVREFPALRPTIRLRIIEWIIGGEGAQTYVLSCFIDAVVDKALRAIIQNNAEPVSVLTTVDYISTLGAIVDYIVVTVVLFVVIKKTRKAILNYASSQLRYKTNYNYMDSYYENSYKKGDIALSLSSSN